MRGSPLKKAANLPCSSTTQVLFLEMNLVLGCA